MPRDLERAKSKILMFSRQSAEKESTDDYLTKKSEEREEHWNRALQNVVLKIITNSKNKNQGTHHIDYKIALSKNVRNILFYSNNQRSIMEPEIWIFALSR